MSTSQNPGALLASLLSNLATGAVKVVELEIDPSRPIEEQIAGIGDKLAAKHREECAGCRAKYEAEQAKPKDTRATGFDPNLAAPYGGDMPKAAQPKPLFRKIGFAAFVGERIIPQSFSVEREDVEAAVHMFKNDPMYAMVNSFLGVNVAELQVEVRPLFDKREG